MQRLENAGEIFIPTEEIEQNTSISVLDKEYFDFSKLFGNDNPVYLEIGCGQGAFACELAKQNPQINVLAVERISTVILSGVENALKQELKNIRFLRTKAECLPKYVKPNSIEKIFLNFSTPLPKKGYARQRLTNRRFLALYTEMLTEKGTIKQKTDDKDFFLYSMEEFTGSGFSLSDVTYDLHATNQPNIITEYEAKFVAKGLPIYSLTATKTSKEE